jgi:hypothetical protein
MPTEVEICRQKIEEEKTGQSDLRIEGKRTERHDLRIEGAGTEEHDLRIQEEKRSVRHALTAKSP